MRFPSSHRTLKEIHLSQNGARTLIFGAKIRRKFLLPAKKLLLPTNFLLKTAFGMQEPVCPLSLIYIVREHSPKIRLNETRITD